VQAVAASVPHYPEHSFCYEDKTAHARKGIDLLSVEHGKMATRGNIRPRGPHDNRVARVIHVSRHSLIAIEDRRVLKGRLEALEEVHRGRRSSAPST
jgi:hypothetical protein